MRHIAGIFGHYQDLSISSVKGHDSSCNLIISVDYASAANVMAIRDSRAGCLRLSQCIVFHVLTAS